MKKKNGRYKETHRIVYYKNDKYHRLDGPAIEYDNGVKYWCINGSIHREGGPAIEYEGGHKEWYKDGLLHREDGPAVEYETGEKEWWIEGRQCKDRQILALDILDKLEKIIDQCGYKLVKK
jgi:hypothetical protein